MRSLSIDRLDREDKAELGKILDDAGLYRSDIADKLKSASEIRDVVLAVYKNTDVAEKVRISLEPVLANPDSQFVFISAQLLRWLDVHVPPEFLSQAGKVDAHAAIAGRGEIAADLFKLDDGAIEPRSALFAQYLLESSFSPDQIMEVCRKLIVASASRRNERHYRSLMGGLMQVGRLKDLLRGKPGADGRIRTLFEQLARDVLINKEPLFWLQYAILMMDVPDFDAAENFLNTAYERAALLYGFKPFQIDTQALRIYLEIETSAAIRSADRTDQIIKGLRDATQMLSDTSHRYHVIKVLSFVEPYVKRWVRDLTISEANLFIVEINRVQQALNALEDGIRAATASDTVSAQLGAAIGHLTASRG